MGECLRNKEKYENQICDNAFTGRCVCALFYDNVCRELKVAEPENMTGRIYIGRVKMWLKI